MTLAPRAGSPRRTIVPTPSAGALLILLLTAGAVACAPGRPMSDPGAAPRVISLHDVTTEIVVALGAVDRLVGVAGPVDQPAAVVAATAQVPRVDGTESIIARHPTVVLGTEVVQQQSPDLVRLLRAQGVNVVLAQPHKLPDVFDLVATVAEVVGRPQAGAALVARLRARVAAVERQIAPGRQPLRVFVYDCCDPAFTAGGRAVLSDLVQRAGGHNLFADLDKAWSKVPWETVLQRRPQLIIIDDYDFSGQGDAAGKRDRLRALPSLADVPTTVMPLGEALGGIRSVDGLERLARVLRGQAG
jgi:iron complex transport system substrate-binding protein